MTTGRGRSRLLEDERVDFIQDGTHVDPHMPGLLPYRVPTPKLVTDTCLVALAAAESRRIVTLDQGFRQFEGVDVDLLNR